MRYEIMKQMRQDGESLETIGKTFGLSRQRVHQILNGESGATQKEELVANCKYSAIRQFFAENPNMSANSVSEYARRNGFYIGVNKMYDVLHNKDVSINVSDFDAWRFVFGMPIEEIFKVDS